MSEKMIDFKKFIARGHERLFKEQMGSEEKALEAKTDVELSLLKLDANKIALREKTVLSPLSGTVVKKYKESGESISREEKLVDGIAKEMEWLIGVLAEAGVDAGRGR